MSFTEIKIFRKESCINSSCLLPHCTDFHIRAMMTVQCLNSVQNTPFKRLGIWMAIHHATMMSFSAKGYYPSWMKSRLWVGTMYFDLSWNTFCFACNCKHATGYDYQSCICCCFIVFNLWKQLITQGRKILAYIISIPRNTNIPITYFIAVEILVNVIHNAVTLSLKLR
jgi:hypothetical protein